MVREVVTINIGQAGIQLGQSIWEQYLAEHNIDHKGGRIKSEDKAFHVFFEETINGKYVPRNISVDLEPNVIDDVKNSSIASLFDPRFLINGKEDAANNFARGYYTVGKEIIAKVNDSIRKLVNNCENLQGFIMNHSVGGGTGSGLGSLILERLNVDYKKKSVIGFEIYPSPTISTCVVEPYNALLSTHYLIDNINVSILLDNEAIYRICQKKLNIMKPSYENLNRLIAKTISSMTTSLRFEGELNVDLHEFQTNLVPFPRLHFMVSSMSPIQSRDKALNDKFSIQKISDECFQSSNMFVKIDDYNYEEDKYMAVSLNYRGQVNSKDTSSAIQWLKNNKKLSFVEWCPTGFKIGLNNNALSILPSDDIAFQSCNAVMLGNNTCIHRIFNDRIIKKYDLLYSQRAFVHWFVGEGMEEGEFAEARENLSFLEKDYLDVLTETKSDEETNVD